MNSQSVFVKPTKGKKVWSKILDIAKHPQGWQLLVNIDGKEKFLDVSEHEYKELGYAPGLLFKQGGSTGIPISFGMVLRLISATPQAAKLFEYKQFFTELFSEDNKLKGGAGDATAPADVDPTELAMGITVESEHTDDEKIATEIALDHLTENPKYYSTLKKTGLAPELNDMSSSSGLGDPKHVINKPHRQGHDQTPDAGHNVVGKMHSTPPVDGTDGKDHDLSLPPKNRLRENESLIDSIPLPDGNYYVLRYGYTLEVKMTKDFSTEGKKFKTKTGVRCGRDYCGGPQKVTIKSGQIVTPLLEQDERYSQIPNTQRNLVGSTETTNTGETGLLGHRSKDKVVPSLTGLFETTSAGMILSEPTLEAALKKLVGIPLSTIQDKVSYTNLYIGNKYGIGGAVPPKEQLIQNFLNHVVTWLFQKKVWPTNYVFDQQIEDAKKGKMSSEFADYMEKEKTLRIKMGDIAKRVLAAKKSAFQDPDYLSARDERTALGDAHAWTNFERQLRKQKDEMIRTNTKKPVETSDVTPLATDITEARKTYEVLKDLWDKIQPMMMEMAMISKQGKSVMADKTPLKGLKPEEAVQGNIVIFRVPTDGGLYAKGFTLIFFMDSDQSAKDMKEGKLPYLMVPRGTFYSGGSPISDIWKKKFQKPGTEHILGVFEGNSNDEEIFVDMITVRPGYQRNTIATKMIAAIKREYPNAKVSTSSKTPQGEKFFKTITEGGAKMLGKGLTSDMHGKRWTIDAFDNESPKGATPRIDEIKVLQIIQEIAYTRNIGFAEVYKFFQVATPEQKTEFDKLVGEDKIREAWELVQKVTGTQLRGMS